MDKILPKATLPPFNLKVLGAGGPKSPRKFLKLRNLNKKSPFNERLELNITFQRKFSENSAKSPQKNWTSRIMPLKFLKIRNLESRTAFALGDWVVSYLQKPPVDAFLPNIKKPSIAGAYLSITGNVFHDFALACSECTRRAGARAGLHHKFRPLRMVRQ